GKLLSQVTQPPFGLCHLSAITQVPGSPRARLPPVHDLQRAQPTATRWFDRRSRGRLTLASAPPSGRETDGAFVRCSSQSQSCPSARCFVISFNELCFQNLLQRCLCRAHYDSLSRDCCRIVAGRFLSLSNYQYEFDRLCCGRRSLEGAAERRTGFAADRL